MNLFDKEAARPRQTPDETGIDRIMNGFDLVSLLSCRRPLAKCAASH